MTRNALRWLAVLWIAGVIAGSVMPTRLKLAFGTTMESRPDYPPPNFSHRVYHFVSFGVAAMLLLLLATNLPQKLRASASVILLGVAIELTQHFILLNPYFEWWDVRDDTISVLAAVM